LFLLSSENNSLTNQRIGSREDQFSISNPD